jgi:hypothetical protein
MPIYERSLNELRQFMHKMNTNENKNLPFISMSLFNTYSHDFMYIPERYDSYLKETIEMFEKNGYLNNTMFILMSDHGKNKGFFLVQNFNFK